MRDKQIIEKIQLLRSIKPDEETIRLIHKQSTAQLFGEKRYGIRKWSITSAIPYVALLVILLFFFSVSVLLPNSIHTSIISARIALAPNHYEKAKIAVAHAESEFASFSQQPNDANKLSDFSQALAIANTQMTNLKLKGEKGKYTMQDCLSLYTTYYTSLESMKQTLISQTNSSNKNKSLYKQINQYDQQAEKKLHLYK